MWHEWSCGPRRVPQKRFRGTPNQQFGAWMLGFALNQHPAVALPRAAIESYDSDAAKAG